MRLLCHVPPSPYVPAALRPNGAALVPLLAGRPGVCWLNRAVLAPLVGMGLGRHCPNRDAPACPGARACLCRAARNALPKPDCFHKKVTEGGDMMALGGVLIRGPLLPWISVVRHTARKTFPGDLGLRIPEEN